MTRSLLAIYGAAGCGRGIMPLLRSQAADEEAELVFVDDGQAGAEINGHRVLSFEHFIAADAGRKAITIAIADPAIRQRLAIQCEKADLEFLTVTAREHVRMDACEIGPGGLFSPFTTLTSNIRIGRHFHCNINSYVEHDCVLGDFVTFAPGVQCNGNIFIGDRVYIGAGAMIRQGRPGAPLRIGNDAVVGMGAVVLTDVPDGAVVAGNPARVIRQS